MPSKFYDISVTNMTRRGLLAGIALGALGSVKAAAHPAIARPWVSGTDLVVGPGENRIDHNLIVDGQLIVMPGGRIFIAAGATLTLRGDMIVPAARIFWGEGKVDLTQSRLLAARPEWWGARADDSSIDSLPALAACLDAHISTALGQGTYYIGNTWTIDRPNRRIWGIGRTKDAFGTRIALTRGGRGTVVRIGTERAPPSINEYLAGIDIRGIELGRNAGAIADGDDPAIGLSIRHVLDCRLEDLRANEHAICYSLRGAVRTYLRDCRAFRSIAEPSSGGSFIGFDLDGRNPPIATGANASIYITDCNASIGTSLADAVGIRMLGAMSDTFVTRFETTSMPVGILLDGSDRRLGQGPGALAQIDVHINTPVLDQCGETGISVTGLGAMAMVEITSPYVALADTGTAAVSVRDFEGNLRISGGQLIGSLSMQAAGLKFERSTGFSVNGAALLGFARPVIVRDSTGFELQVAVVADSVGHGSAISLERCKRGYLRPRLSGRARAHAAAVAIDAASRALSIEMIEIDSAVLTDAEAIVAVAGRAMKRDGRHSVVFLPF